MSVPELSHLHPTYTPLLRARTMTLAITEAEAAILQGELEAWPNLSRREKNEKKNDFTTQFLRGRQRDSKDEYNRAVMFQVCRYLSCQPACVLMAGAEN